MTALVGMRLGAYVRAQYAIAPLLAGLVVLAALYGGGVARPEEAYGASAAILFPVLAWQVKILLDAEPDVQRRLVRVAAGRPAREIGAGLAAGALTAVPTILLALVLPWLLNGVASGVRHPGDPEPLPVAAAIGVGVWAHLIVLPAAVALGAWASRPISRTAGKAVAVLVGGFTLALVLGLKVSPAPWLAPPLITIARAAGEGFGAGEALRLTLWALAWALVPLAGYVWLRRQRRI